MPYDACKYMKRRCSLGSTVMRASLSLRSQIMLVVTFESRIYLTHMGASHVLEPIGSMHLVYLVHELVKSNTRDVK
jgi:hypothetical protein